MRSATPSGRLSKGPTAGFAPASTGLQDRRLAVRPRRLFEFQAGARGFEPRRMALEAICSPRSTLLYCPRPCDQGHLA